MTLHLAAGKIIRLVRRLLETEIQLKNIITRFEISKHHTDSDILKWCWAHKYF